ncbi:hypothetical protein Tco_0765541 [Tanacetum coccineum]
MGHVSVTITVLVLFLARLLMCTDVGFLSSAKFKDCGCASCTDSSNQEASTHHHRHVYLSLVNIAVGYFQPLFSYIEELIASLNVQILALPAADEVGSIWTNKFWFQKIPDVEVVYGYAFNCYMEIMYHHRVTTLPTLSDVRHIKQVKIVDAGTVWQCRRDLLLLDKHLTDCQLFKVNGGPIFIQGGN